MNRAFTYIQSITGFFFLFFLWYYSFLLWFLWCVATNTVVLLVSFLKVLIWCKSFPMERAMIPLLETIKTKETYVCVTMDMKSTISDAKETKTKNTQKVETNKDDIFEKKIKRENLWCSWFLLWSLCGQNMLVLLVFYSKFCYAIKTLSRREQVVEIIRMKEICLAMKAKSMI